MPLPFCLCCSALLRFPFPRQRFSPSPPPYSLTSVPYHKATSIFLEPGKIIDVCGVEIRTKKRHTPWQSSTEHTGDLCSVCCIGEARGMLPSWLFLLVLVCSLLVLSGAMRCALILQAR